MQARYALRFDSGERKGERVPVTGAGVTVGRKPGNSVQLLDASVSGRHAEFVVDAAGILLRDLGSTNGTRVGGERVSEQRLQHGDQVLLGNVRLTFLDTEQPAPAPVSEGGDVEVRLDSDGAEAPRGAGAENTRFVPSSESGDAVRTISADKVARSAKLSKVGAVGLLLVVGLGAGGWWWIRSQQGGGVAAVKRGVEATPGNLLGDTFSFEGVELDGEGAAWLNDPSAPAAFTVERVSRYSGDDGLGALLGAGQFALARSRSMPLAGARSLQLAAQVRVEGGARARVGLEFESSTDASARTIAWSPTASEAGDFALLEWTCGVPQGFDALRVVLSGRGGASEGSVSIDDVVLLAGGQAPAPLALDSFQLASLGAPSTAAVLFKIDRTLLSDLHVRRNDGEREEFGAVATDSGFRLTLERSAGRVLSVRADGALTMAAPASLGQGGYRSHAASFEREGLTRVVLGAGKDLVTLAFDAPVRAQGLAEGAGLRLEFALGDTTRVDVQVAFRAERETALAIAREAREAERSARYGEAIAAWNRLRDEAPFDSELLAESDAARSRLAERGLGELRALRAEVERARFFRLVELYRQCRANAEAIATRYAGGELETAARDVVVEVRRDLDVLEADLNKTERARLESIHRALAASKSDRLAQRVRDYLDERFAAAAADGGGR